MTNLEKVQQSLEGNTVLENKPIKFKTVNIHGKEYVMVNERLLYFWEHYKQYSIITEIISVTDEKIIMKATIKNENENEIGTFSLKFLNLFCKSSTLCATIQLYMKADFPLVIIYSVADLGTVKYCLLGCGNTEDEN